MKDLLIKASTGIIAKMLRYGLTAAGGAKVFQGTNQGETDVTQLATGLAIIAVSFGQSMWEDHVKKRQALRDSLKTPLTPPPTSP